MYKNVIVPFDGTIPGRVVLAPAADLAWRCGARIVIVNNTEVSDANSRAALKTRAMSLSGADVDFWVDSTGSIGRALLDAARHRDDAVICVSARNKATGLRKSRVLPPTAEEVLADAPCPVLLIGPETDVSRGLPMTELVVALDGSPYAEQILPLAVDWCRSMRLRLVLAGVVAADKPGPHDAEVAYLQGHLDAVADRVPEAGMEVLLADDPATGLVGFLADRPDSIIAMSTHGRSGKRRGPLGAVAARVVEGSPRAILVRRPD